MSAASAAASPNPSHLPVLYAQVLAGLRVRADGIYLDGTFGRGGHAAGVLSQLGEEGRLLVMDKDPTAITEAEARFAGAVVPRPPGWSGFRVVPDAVEFWFGAQFRLHERWLHERDAGGRWQQRMLYP